MAQGGESFDLTQDREALERPAEPRISPACGWLVRNDMFSALCHSLRRQGETVTVTGFSGLTPGWDLDKRQASLC
jgi:hypothetical protein